MAEGSGPPDPPASSEIAEDGGPPRGRGRVRAATAGVKTRVEQTRNRIEQARPSSAVIDAAMSTFEHDVASGGGVLAGAVAFRIFMFLVPYVFTAVAGFGIAAEAAEMTPQEAAQSAGIGGLAAQAVSSVGDGSWGQRLTALIVGGAALFLAARSAVKVLAIVHALVWRVTIEPVRRTNRYALAFIGLVTVGLLLVHFISEARAGSTVGGIVLMLLYTAVPIGLWLFVTWRMPRAAEVTWRALVPGAVLFGVGTQVLHVVTVVWIAHQVSSKSETYGAIGTALAMLLWAFLLGRLITAAAELNAILWWRRQS